MSTYDCIIRGGTVVDGSGLPGYRADVGISGGRIAAIGRVRDSAAREIDAEGHIVAIYNRNPNLRRPLAGGDPAGVGISGN